ncbi:unnamed protein product [Strongylus vulgaris]|uniref:Uncharacterized protein n=1 Tax=Strongylus vulgaris TaxID=40348 RepID=A0A3P7JK55_STRVU|nr:unnamed protein product [Strongylus vulgaris]
MVVWILFRKKMVPLQVLESQAKRSSFKEES